jgi:hypothetical protein
MGIREMSKSPQYAYYAELLFNEAEGRHPEAKISAGRSNNPRQSK